MEAATTTAGSRVLLISAVLVVTLMFGALQMAAQTRPVGQIVGVVRDQNSALVGGGNAKLRDEATGAERTTQVSDQGVFAFSDMMPGLYSVTISSPGFSTKTITGVKVEAARTADLSVALEVGAIEEVVTVAAGAAIVERTNTAVGTNVSGDYIRSLPLNNRDTIDFVLLTPGAQQVGVARISTFLGLPKAAINLTVDGLNDQLSSARSTSDVLNPPVKPRIDAVEELSIITAAGGANLSGDGAIQIQLVTRRGTNRYRGLLFWEHRNDWLNANTWFNNAAGLPRQKNLLNNFGGNVGGPIIRNRLFFFFNYEDFHYPQTLPDGNLILTREAASGVFRYRGTDGVERTRNLLSLAGAAGFPSTLDPMNSDMLRQIDDARPRGSISNFDLIRERFDWQAPSLQIRRYPVLRLDYEINAKLHWQGVWNYNYSSTFPDILNSMEPTFPGIGKPAGQYSKRYSLTTALQWLISPVANNEVRFGTQQVKIDTWPESGTDIYPRGVRLLWPLNVNSLDSRPSFPNTARFLAGTTRTPSYNVQDNLTWAHGSHSFSFGGGLSFETSNSLGFNGNGNGGIPFVNFVPVAGDPISNALAAGLPAVAAADLNNAIALYNLLTGRISRVSGTRNVDKTSKRYVNLAPLAQDTRGRNGSLYFQDSWRVRPNLTLNYGLGWQFQSPYSNPNGTFTSPTFAALWGVSGVGNLFNPGALNGIANPQIDLRPDHLYKPDFVNPAPSVGIAWTMSRPFLRPIFGSPYDSVFRAGYSISYAREGDALFSQAAASSPGQTQSISLTAGTDYVPGTVLLRNALPTFQEFPTSFSFPTAQSLYTFSGVNFATIDPNLRTPYVQSWSVGWQRELGKNMAIEARYVGNHGLKFWRSVNLNEVNIFENGFLNEFKNAQRNLAVSRAAGVSNFANRGLAGQVPLPIFEAAFGARGTQPALGNAQGFTNPVFINLLDQGQSGSFAASLAAQASFLCRVTGNRLAACASRNFNVGGPFAPNFFQVNPDGAGNFVGYLTNGTSSTYNGLQVEFRRRMSAGLMLNASYIFSKSLGNTALGDVTLRDPQLSKTPSPFDLRHAFVTSWVFELPFGPGRRWKSKNAIVNKLIEGWNVLGITRIQSGRSFSLTSGRQTVNGSDAGVILKGITVQQLQKMIRFREVQGSQDVFFVDANLIGADGRANHTYLDYPTTPGAFGSIIFLHSPHFARTNLSVSKSLALTERARLELWFDFFNAFNTPNFLIGQPGSSGGTVSIDSTTFGRTRNFFADLTQNQDPGPRMIQIRMRLSF